MSISDWDAWMKKRGIYIPTEEEVRKAIELGSIKVKPVKGGKGREKRNQGFF